MRRSIEIRSESRPRLLRQPRHVPVRRVLEPDDHLRAGPAERLRLLVGEREVDELNR